MKTLIIAEAGVNHNGSIEIAKQLIDAAAAAGVDYVKFQTFKAEKLVSSTAIKADYQIENTKDAAETQLQMLQKLELSEDDHDELISYTKQKGISFFSTAFDLDSLAYLSKIGLRLVKIPSGEITNLPYLRLAAKLFEQFIISTGMATMEEVKMAINVFIDAGIAQEHITILHCNTEYPTPMKDVNLLAMLTLKEELGVAIGYSDHTLGIEVPIAAVALGATVIEKHFTLDKNMAGPDHVASLEPNELKAMVISIRNIEAAINGSGKKEPSESEMKNISVARKSIVAKRPINRGEIFTEQNLTVKRPGSGISPMEWDSIVGAIAIKDYQTDELITK